MINKGLHIKFQSSQKTK